MCVCLFAMGDFMSLLFFVWSILATLYYMPYNNYDNKFSNIIAWLYCMWFKGLHNVKLIRDEMSDNVTINSLSTEKNRTVKENSM